MTRSPNQPPDAVLLSRQLERARRELEPGTFEWFGQFVTDAWAANEVMGIHQAQWTAMELLHYAANLRHQHRANTLADILSATAEAFCLGWQSEILVQTSVQELDLI